MLQVSRVVFRLIFIDSGRIIDPFPTSPSIYLFSCCPIFGCSILLIFSTPKGGGRVKTLKKREKSMCLFLGKKNICVVEKQQK
uniref:Uncharacterized protein n=1 Tax=Meloidogyne enterolobii TaxID=390850 RepID=A0A6V7URU0_MELEN|nr:unnamed protein product [Meloidogyne enterolobii]